MSKLRFLFFAVLAIVLSTKAIAQFGDCLYQHELEQPTELIHEVKLPPTAFAKTGGDRYNFRVYGVAASGDTLEMPWAYPGHKALIISAPLERLNAGRTVQGDRFTYEALYTEPIHSLELIIGNKDFEGSVTLEGANKLDDWQTVLSNYRIIDLSNNGGPYRFTTLKFKKSLYRYYRVTIQGIKNLDLREVSYTLGPVFQYDTISFAGHIEGPKQITKFPKTSVYELELAESVLIDQLSLNIADTLRYVRQVEVQVLQDSFKQGEEMKYRYKTVGRGSLSSLDPNQPIGFDPVVAHQIRVLISNQDNQPLTITGMKAGVKEPRINVRFNGAEKYYLAYGCKSLSRPNYDVDDELATLRERPKALDLAPLNSFVIQSPSDSIKGLFSNSLWLYGALVLVAALLGWMAIGMMKK